MDMEQGRLEREKSLIKLLSRENETYAKFELINQIHGKQIIYVKGTWYPTHFMIFVLDGQDTWNFNATQDFVAHEAIKLEMEVEEWLDQVHKYFCHQHVESQYSFVSTNSDFKMLQCSYFDKILGERNTISLVLHKTSSCGEATYHMLGLLVDTNTKQQEELAQKTRDIHRMAAEIRELRTNPEDHFRMENDSFRSLQLNSLSTSEHFQDESIDEFNSGHEEQFTHDKNKEIMDTNQNTQYWTYDTSEDNPHPILRPLDNHFHSDDLDVQTQQPHEFHKSISNHYDMNDISHIESGEGSLLTPMEYMNNEDYNIPSQRNEKHELHHFSYVVPCHYVEGLLKNYPKNNTKSQSENDQPTLYLYVAPKKIMIEKKIIVDTEFRENISMSGPSSYKQNTKSNKNNWSLKPPTLDNEMHYHDEFSPSIPTNESSDHLSIQLAIFDQIPNTNTTTNPINDMNEHISTISAPTRHASILKQYDKGSSDVQIYPKRGSKVNFHHTTQEEKSGKIYYKTPKHSYSKSKFENEDDEEEQVDFEIPSNVPRNQNRSYVVNSNENKDDQGRRSRWSSPSQLALHDLDLESPSHENKSDDQISEHYDDETLDILKNETIVANNESHNINATHELNSTSDTHSVHPILHHKGDHHQHHDHINWGENETSDNFALGSQPHHLKIHNSEEQITHQEHVNLCGEFAEQITHQEHVNLCGEFGEQNIQKVPESIFEVSAPKEDVEQIQPINKEPLTLEPSKSESSEPPSLLDKIYLSFESLTTPSISENTNQDTIQSTSTDEATNLFQESQTTKEKTIENSLLQESQITKEKTIEDSLLQESQITKDKPIENSNESLANNSKKRKSSSKTPKMSKSTSFVQSFLSLFQGSQSDAKDSSDTKNDEKDSSDPKNNTEDSNDPTNDAKDSRDPKSTNQENDANAVLPDSKLTLEKSNELAKNDDVSIISNIFSSFHEPFFFQPTLAKSDTIDKKESLLLNQSSQEHDAQHKTPETSERESIDDGIYDMELPHRKMDAVRKASVDEVRKELILKLGNQQEQEPERTPPLDTVMENSSEVELEDKFVEANDNKLVEEEESNEAFNNDKEEAKFPLEHLNHLRHEPRRYSIDKIDLGKARGMQQGSQSVSIARTSLYSNLQGRSTKSTVQHPRIDEFDSDIHSMNKMVNVENNIEVKELMNEEDGQASQEKFYDQTSVIHSKRTSSVKVENKDQTSLNYNHNANMTDLFGNRVLQSIVPPVNETSTHESNENIEDNNRNNTDSISLATAENNSDESVLCVARIRFVFPGKPASLPMLQNHATSTSSTPNNSNFNVGLRFNNEDSQGGGS